MAGIVHPSREWGNALADVSLTKQAAAHRLLLSATRMVQREDDPIAIHVVASSALNLLRELLRQRGPGLVDLAIREGFYRAAKARSEGKPTPFPKHEELDRLLDWIAARIQDGDVESANDLNMTGTFGDERAMLDPIIAPFNFLKHAQRDPLVTLNENDVNPYNALYHAVGAYCFLFPEALPSEIAELVTDDEFLSRTGIPVELR